MTSACRDRRAKDVCIQAMVIPELKFVDVEMQVLFAHLVERADNAALHDGPETFNRVGMNRSAHIFAVGMMHQAVWDARIEGTIPAMIICRKQANSMRYGFMHESIERGGVRAFDHASHDIALALDRAHDDAFADSACAAEVPASAFAFVFILGLPAHIGFVHFDIAHEFLKFDIAERHADFVAHQPGGFVGAKAHVATDLQGADALFTRKHQVNDAEPDAQRLVRILKDRAHQDGKAIADTAWRALIALPVIVLRVLMHILVAAARATDTVRPPMLDQIVRAGIAMELPV